jgi:hypothetical protein
MSNLFTEDDLSKHRGYHKLLAQKTEHSDKEPNEEETHVFEAIEILKNKQDRLEQRVLTLEAQLNKTAIQGTLSIRKPTPKRAQYFEKDWWKVFGGSRRVNRSRKFRKTRRNK